MSECKCGCGRQVEQVSGKVARQWYSDACRKAYGRANPGQDHASTPDKPTPDTQPRTTPDTGGAGISVTHPSVTDQEPINWADPDKDYSTIARQTQGKIQVPGDPGYVGVCKQVDGQWCVPA